MKIVFVFTILTWIEAIKIPQPLLISKRGLIPNIFSFHGFFCSNFLKSTKSGIRIDIQCQKGNIVYIALFRIVVLARKKISSYYLWLCLEFAILRYPLYKTVENL